MQTLLISVRLHDGRYHGSGEWPPSPARLFQALVAGAARGEKLSEPAVEALEWLERLAAPAISAPSAYAGQPFKTFVPNNDLDAVGGDPARIGEIRAGKLIRPRIFDAAAPLLYAWTFKSSADAECHARAICGMADNLYQLGRGVDMAWAEAELVDESEATGRLHAHAGVLWRPNESGDGVALACPQRGSLASLTLRFGAMRKRFSRVGEGKKAGQLFSQPPKPHFGQIPYNSPSTFLLFDIRNADDFAPHPHDRAVDLTETIRDLAVRQLKASVWHREDPKREACIENVFIGRDATEADKARRIRITPLPSIGYVQTERSIRRMLVTVPPDCPIAPGDISWAFSGLTLADPESGEVSADNVTLVPAGDRAMLTHYGIEDATPARLWRSVTPAALPERAARRRIDPRRMREEAKGGAERERENEAAASAVAQALRHSDVNVPVEAVRVQREPFDAKGRRAEAFAPGTRFAKERLWHVEIAFARPVAGPLLIGDGRYLGLGLMAPVRRPEGILAFSILDGLTERAEPQGLARALRRAVMTRVQAKAGERAKLPSFFTGHTDDGSPSRPGRHEHLAFAFDAPRKRLLIVAPHVIERREAFRDEREKHLPLLAEALEDFRELRAGAGGKLTLTPCALGPSENPLISHSRIWESLTPYRVTRHSKLNDAAVALEADLLAECQRAGLPRPKIEVIGTSAKAGIGLSGLARLSFAAAVAGPILLGRDRHFGGGLFMATTR